MDTHAVINTLMSDYNLSQKQAEAVVYATQATHEEKRLVMEDMLDKKVAELKYDLTIRVIIIVGVGSAFLTLVKFFG